MSAERDAFILVVTLARQALPTKPPSSLRQRDDVVAPFASAHERERPVSWPFLSEEGAVSAERDAFILEVTLARQALLTKPPGSLRRQDEVVAQFASMREREPAAARSAP